MLGVIHEISGHNLVDQRDDAPGGRIFPVDVVGELAFRLRVISADAAACADAVALRLG